MPINPIVLQKRHVELGRIRLGDKGDKGQPQKLSAIRFTSPHQNLIEDLATLYGGECRPWKNGTKDEFECYSTAKSIPVIIVKGAFSQWMETWSGGGCQHRCDGVIDQATGKPCDPDDKAHQAARPTTRCSMMLPGLEAVGLFRLETHGWNAGAELPPMVELAQHLGSLVPARLMLADRTTIKDGRTNRFVVPTLDLGISASQLVAAVNGAGPQAIQGATPAAAIEAPRVPDDLTDAIADCHTADEVRELWRTIGNNGQLTDLVKDALMARAAELTAAESPVEATVEPDIDHAMVGSDTGEAYMRVVAAVGVEGWSDAQMRAALQDRFAQPVEDLDAAQMDLFLEELRDGRISVPA